ncbi:DHH family phosphoesterase [Celerinatantimonas diazotrophica]|uniref:DHH family phosphoesterase n=1 Tax=Celerinatantimonas diazotrophica TaxID=412034 RepID=A0A4R1JLZ6_9GAMM|nr:DHH family phosphoesterase [Celerinatantimonas diazotrophica]TCK52098.1 hypothetical protein EV690_2206 [Celerinatantimonas diazotrophica]CAG9296197.1 hypothetical protein CEDIAZO_01340 [Celerinatantimonas diazotrophica]
MSNIDVFNGDADGIVALLQLRWRYPQQSTLVTGVKRDIQLLQRVDVAAGDNVCVLDISAERNGRDLKRILEAGAHVFYVDHHRRGDIPLSPNLVTRIDPDPYQCTSTLVDQYLNGAYRSWAVAAAFGDNLTETAIKLARSLSLTTEQTNFLKELGILLNYNGYGREVNDLHYHPAELYKQLQAYPDPFALMLLKDSVFTNLQDAYQRDMAKAKNSPIVYQSDNAVVILLADAPWSRRVSGVYGNELANQNPERAHGVVTDNGDDTYTVSVRAPINRRSGADEICSQFPNGGGRAAAAGINQLPCDQLESFWQILSNYYQQH